MGLHEAGAGGCCLTSLKPDFAVASGCLIWHDQRQEWQHQHVHPSWRGGFGMVEIAPRIVVDETIRSGKPVIQGTRVPVDLVLGKLAGGMTIDEVMAEYELAREDILAALAYAARSIADNEVRAVKR